VVIQFGLSGLACSRAGETLSRGVEINNSRCEAFFVLFIVLSSRSQSLIIIKLIVGCLEAIYIGKNGTNLPRSSNGSFFSGRRRRGGCTCATITADGAAFTSARVLVIASLRTEKNSRELFFSPPPRLIKV
jgi:hypothetical protein